MQLVSLTLIHWIVIYTVDNTMQRLDSATGAWPELPLYTGLI